MDLPHNGGDNILRRPNILSIKTSGNRSWLYLFELFLLKVSYRYIQSQTLQAIVKAIG